MDASTMAATTAQSESKPTSVYARAFTQRQIVTMVVVGVIGWYIAATCIRLGEGTALFARGPAHVALFAAAIPVGWFTAWACARLGSLRKGQIVLGATLASAAAMVCDGVALTWTPRLYGETETHRTAAGALLLWGVAMIVFGAFFEAARDRREEA